MRHTRTITRKRPAKAQSAYASKLLFKQDAATLISFNVPFLVAEYSAAFQTLVGNALSLGVFYTWADFFGDDTGGQS